ncbi:YxeA family protein [Enterococcus sp. 669A]|uniref:YxeA family protein n=1 Tax=Candidatus Enterococcus moelleringii TaxID=2815325 RepID=A0ABS3L6T9_9ENTE|nr:YxeA family protein [Enterococcus sp. 669A]
MKKSRRIVVAIMLILVFLVLVEPKMTKNQTNDWAAIADLVNPFVKVEKVYVKIEDPKELVQLSNNSDHAAYTATSYNDCGQPRKISYHADYKPATGRYLELTAKGQNVRSWKEVLPAQVPVEARDRLR